jgi:dihydroneopterin aldolase
MPRDCIRLANLQFYTHHGVHPAERELGGRFSLDVELYLDLRPAGETDDLSLTVDYAAVYRLLAQVISARKFLLLEALAHHAAEVILAQFPVDEVRLRLRKHAVPLGGLADFAEVEITRTRA